MLGALIIKSMLPSAMDAVNQRDLEKIMSHWHKDGCLIFPGNTKVSGRHQGKDAVENFFSQYIQQFEKIHFSVKKTYLDNIFSFSLSNSMAIEFECEYTNKHGHTYQNSGISVATVKRGKTIKVQDYYFDIPALNQAWL